METGLVERSQFVPVSRLAKPARMSIAKIRVKDGEVVMMEPYNRLQALATHVALLDLLEQRGGGDDHWLGQFRKRMTEARDRRIQMEVDKGVVVRLPGPKS